jgi:ketosteroid isomerase-like protein
MGEAENRASIERLWDLWQARAWDDSIALFHPDVEMDWPHTCERFVGSANVVDMNRAYPEGWSIELLRVVPDGDAVVSEIRVTAGDELFFAASFFGFEDGLIRRVTEYWVTSPYEEPPAWREPFRVRPGPAG